MRITFKQLALFVTIAKRENITQAANQVYLSQPAASMTLAELETQLGRALFDRVGKRLVLNANGEKLLAKANELVDRVKEVENIFRVENSLITGNLTIGASTTLGNYILPVFISRFMQKFPQVKISLHIANTEQIISELENYNLDVGFIEGSCNSNALTISNWGEDQLVVCASAKHPLAKKSSVSLQELQQTAWILREAGSGTREILEKHFKPKHVALELGSSESIKQAVKQGIGISCLSQATLLEELKAKSLVKLNTPRLKIKRNFYQLIHKEKYQSDALLTFLKEAEISTPLHLNM